MNRWNRAVMKAYRRNRKAGLAAAARKAKRTYRRKKK